MVEEIVFADKVGSDGVVVGDECEEGEERGEGSEEEEI